MGLGRPESNFLSLGVKSGYDDDIDDDDVTHMTQWRVAS